MKEKTHKSRKRTEALSSAQKRYDRNNTQHISLKLNKRTDADILEWIGRQRTAGQSVQGTIKSLIRDILPQR